MPIRHDAPTPWLSWGADLEKGSIDQMQNACSLPVAAAGALMPDAHVGYGLPIGGVLATRNCVIPYAVGVDIACRMKLSVLDISPKALEHEHERKRLIKALEGQTCFGVGGRFDRRKENPVMDLDWSVSPVTEANKDRAWSQLGTSGSGNHFVEYGLLTVPAPHEAPGGGARFLPSGTAEAGSGWRFDLAPGTYLALLSHSGSRGTGAAVCDHYSKIAKNRSGRELQRAFWHLAWLDLTSQEGREYWDAMNLMGRYASANHAEIHKAIVRSLGAEVIAGVENHHNFAWLETHIIGGQEEQVVVHRKGATPAGTGVLGVIPGSMATPGFVVVGKGSAESLRSASHGAGRVMSRTKANETFRWGNVKRELETAGVQVLSAGLDEVPGVYKDIHKVMSLQSDLVDVVARFDPKIVKMAPAGEKAED